MDSSRKSRQNRRNTKNTRQEYGFFADGCVLRSDELGPQQTCLRDSLTTCDTQLYEEIPAHLVSDAPPPAWKPHRNPPSCSLPPTPRECSVAEQQSTENVSAFHKPQRCTSGDHVTADHVTSVQRLRTALHRSDSSGSRTSIRSINSATSSGCSSDYLSSCSESGSCYSHDSGIDYDAFDEPCYSVYLSKNTQQQRVHELIQQERPSSQLENEIDYISSTYSTDLDPIPELSELGLHDVLKALDTAQSSEHTDIPSISKPTVSHNITTKDSQPSMCQETRDKPVTASVKQYHMAPRYGQDLNQMTFNSNNSLLNAVLHGNNNMRMLSV